MLGPQWLLIAPVRGFQDGSLIIFIILIFGGTFAILGKTGAIESGIQRLSRFFAKKPKTQKLVIPVLMVVFSLAGAVYGMSEESIPFVLIFIPLALSLGYDSVVGVAIPFVGAAAGFGAAFFNPFTVGIAQGFSELPLYSGLTYRLILWVINTVLSIVFVMIYAEKVRKDPDEEPRLRHRPGPRLHGFGGRGEGPALGPGPEGGPGHPVRRDRRSSSTGSWPRAGTWRRSGPCSWASGWSPGPSPGSSRRTWPRPS